MLKPSAQGFSVTSSMNRVFRSEDFERFNGFYGKAECRLVVLNLYKGICQSCDAKIADDAFHVAHIIPRTHPGLMAKYFPTLDVDNLLNLMLSCPSCNLKVSNFVIDSPLLLHTFNCSAKAISQRFDAVTALLSIDERPVIMRVDDSRICTDVLHLDVNELADISSNWNGAVVISNTRLQDRIRNEMAQVFGHEPDETWVYATLEEAISYFKDRLHVNGRSMSLQGVRNPSWLTEAYSICADRNENDDAKLADGIYLDQVELKERQGLWIPLRTETQRWFFEVIGTLVHTRRKLDAVADHKRYVVLEEGRWRDLCDCARQLMYVQAGLGIPGKRLAVPEVLTHFTVSDGELYIHDDQTIPDEVQRLCLATGESTIWSNSSVLKRSKLKSWLSRAFVLAELGAQKALGPHLVWVEDSQYPRRWAPPLPRSPGRTRELVQQQFEATTRSRTKRHKRQSESDEIFVPQMLL